MNILFGITGGIAAYKIPECIRLLRKHDVHVKTILTPSAKQFVTPLTLQTVSLNPVYDSLWDDTDPMQHITLARWADQIVIAPATADCLAKLAQGRADDLLSTVCLATEAPIAVVPAMNRLMWQAAATQANVALLQQRGVQIWGPDQGDQACGEHGFGRMLEPEAIVSHIMAFERPRPLTGKRVLITAGPTQEAIDPIRYLTNRSSGQMGYALAQQAITLGAEVSLVSGPTSLVPPNGVRLYSVRSALDMHQQVMALIDSIDIFIAAAAVADYRVHAIASHKIKKTPEDWTLQLTRNPDILAEVAHLSAKPFCVGFAAEDQDHEVRGKEKLQRKRIDMIVINDIDEAFAQPTNRVSVLTALGQRWQFDTMPKIQLAEKIWHCIERCVITTEKES